MSLRLVVILVATCAWLQPPPADACSPINRYEDYHDRLDGIPGDDPAAFPVDGTPSVRFGTFALGLADGRSVLPELLDAEGRVVASELESRSMERPNDGRPFEFERWVRLIPHAPLRPDADYTLRLSNPLDGSEETRGFVDEAFPPVPFRTGPSLAEALPQPPSFTVVEDHEPARGLPGPCSNASGVRDVYRASAPTPAAGSLDAMGTVLFFNADEIAPDEVDPSSTYDHARLATELDSEPGPAIAFSRYGAFGIERCWFAITEDVYGRWSEPSDVVCSVPEGSAGCTASGDRSRASWALLLLLGFRRRPTRRR